MPRVKKEIKFLSVREIVRYAIDTYPIIAKQTMGSNGKNTVYQYISRKLAALRLIDGNDKTVAEPVAYLVVDHIIYEKFYKKFENR